MRIMYNFILKKDYSNNDTSSLIMKQNDGRLHTYGEADNYLVEMDDDNTIYFDKIINTCYSYNLQNDSCDYVPTGSDFDEKENLFNRQDQKGKTSLSNINRKDTSLLKQSINISSSNNVNNLNTKENSLKSNSKNKISINNNNVNSNNSIKNKQQAYTINTMNNSNKTKDMQTLQFSNISSKTINRINSNQGLLKQINNNNNNFSHINSKVKEIHNNNYLDRNLGKVQHNNQINLTTSSHNKDEVIKNLSNKILELENKLKTMEKITISKNINTFSPKNQIPKKLNLNSFTKGPVTRTFSNEKKLNPSESNIFNFEAKLKSVKNKGKKKDNFYLFNDWKPINLYSIEDYSKYKDVKWILSNSKEKKRKEFENVEQNNLPINTKIISNNNSNKIVTISQSNNNLYFKSIDTVDESNNLLLKSENNINSNRFIDFKNDLNNLDSNRNDNLMIVNNASINNIDNKNKTDFSFNNSLLYSAKKGNQTKSNLRDSNENLNIKKAKNTLLIKEKQQDFANSLNNINNNSHNMTIKDNSFFSEKGEKSVKKCKEISCTNTIFKPIIPKNSIRKSNNNFKTKKINNNFNSVINTTSENFNVNSNSINNSLNTPKNLMNFSGRFNINKNDQPQGSKNSNFILKPNNKDIFNNIFSSISDKNLNASVIDKNFNHLNSLNSNFTKSKYSNISFELTPNDHKDKSISTKKDENVTEDKTNINSNTELSVSLIKQFKKKSFLIEEIENEEKNEVFNYDTNNKIDNKNRNKFHNNLIKSKSANTGYNNNINNLNTLNNSRNYDTKNLKKISQNLSNNSFRDCKILNSQILSTNIPVGRSQNVKDSYQNNFYQGNDIRIYKTDYSDNTEINHFHTDFGVPKNKNNINNFQKKIQFGNFIQNCNYYQEKLINNNFTNVLNPNRSYNNEYYVDKYNYLNTDISNDLDSLLDRAKFVFDKYNKTCLGLQKIVETEILNRKKFN